MKKTRLVMTVLVALLSGSVYSETLFTVNGNKIDSSDIERRVQFAVANSQGQLIDIPDFRRYVAQETVMETVVVQEAKRLGLDKSNEYKQAEEEALKQAKAEGADKQAQFKQVWSDFQNQLLMRVYALDVIRKQMVSDEEIQKRYQEIAARYQNTEEVQLGEIVTDSAQRASAAAKELSARKSFAEVAKKYSIDPEVQAGQDVLSDYIPLKDLQEARPNIYKAVVNLKKGGIAKPVTGEKIHVVFYMNDRRKISVPTLEASRDALHANLNQERVQLAIDNLMKNAKIVPAH